ncbi:hypothetical protein Tco_0150039 [Tanacetum coccineum]
MKTSISSDTKLMEDEECESVVSTKYRGMIRSLLYLTASRPDIMFNVCLCARFQQAPKTSHLEAVKRIFRYIKGTTHLGLWYPKGTDIEIVVYDDSNLREIMWTKITSGIVHWDVVDILFLRRTNCSCYIHYRSRIRGHRDHVSTCLCHMLYCIETSTPYNLAFFILKRMEKSQNKPKELLPYGMLLTILFKHVVFTGSDHGKKRPHDSNASSSSTTQNHPSSSHPLDETVDVNDEESFRSNSSSPS